MALAMLLDGLPGDVGPPSRHTEPEGRSLAVRPARCRGVSDLFVRALLVEQVQVRFAAIAELRAELPSTR